MNKYIINLETNAIYEVLDKYTDCGGNRHWVISATGKIIDKLLSDIKKEFEVIDKEATQ